MEKHDHNTYRTDVATLNPNDAWYVDAAESNNTDCAASVTGPSLAGEQANQFRIDEDSIHRHYWLAATNGMYPVSGCSGGNVAKARTSNQFPTPPFASRLTHPSDAEPC